jgi:hypothetical protein
MKQNVTAWNESERATLERLSDLLIPGGAGMPSASGVEAHLSGTDKVCRLRPDLVEPVKELLAELQNLQEWSVEIIQSRYPVLFLAASEMLAGAYFLDERVTGILNYQQKLAIPLDDESARVTELQELTLPVVARGNVWRTTV